ncbi:hypothetical protein TL16_g02967 [Triparma laevis f. inornata]|uniref:Uncharacterized protein n=1 Tax=Triparma laevis f. inornata TaxID=1714386 RepID=A0A9W7A2B8_9STRA|nr:hypothetical protein TL16_g02967 [Triparma laevis f. inornata]
MMKAVPSLAWRGVTSYRPRPSTKTFSDFGTASRLFSAGADFSDNSAEAKSRRPFSGPKSGPDDAMPKQFNGSAGGPDVDDRKSGFEWEKLGLLSDLSSGLDSAGLRSPTPIQSMSVPAQLAGDSVAFAAATGSGKTLAYLLPLMQRLKNDEMLMSDEQMQARKVKRPRALIMAPTRELAMQILGVVKDLSHYCKLSSVGIIGGDDNGKQRRSLDRVLDIVVCTPGRLLKHRDAGHVFLGSVSTFVIDETDTMLEAGFQDDIAEMLHPCLYEKGNVDLGLREGGCQVVLTTATMTPAVRRLLADEASSKVKAVKGAEVGAQIKLPAGMRMIEGAGLHRAVPRLRQVFVDVGPTDKISLLSDIVHGGGRGAAQSKVRVFCVSGGGSDAKKLNRTIF